MPEVIISLTDVTIRYPDLSSFSHINFKVNQGEHIALLGNNEPLKSALLDALGGNVSIINGKKVFHFYEDQINNQSTQTLSSPQKLIASVSARHSFRNLSNTNDFYYQQRFNSCDSENSLTVQAYLEGIAINNTHHWSLKNTIDRLNLHHLLDEGLIKLSNGETKRVLLAAALLHNPVLLLLHYPLAGLDIQSRHDIKALINQIAESGVTIVMTVREDEIPEAITHVALADKDNAVSIIPRVQFQPSNSTCTKHAGIDEEEVKALWLAKPTPDFDIIVKMTDVSIRYDDKVILNKINWTIGQGERWALVGPNGAGKSTLLSLINGDNPQAFANNIILFDRKKGSGESIWDIKKKIGFFSPELYQYFPVETTCLQAIESGFYDTIGMFRPSHSSTTQIALRWMKLLGIKQDAPKLLRNLPATNQRLCLLARALVKSPPLLILDEPCQGFDDYLADQFMHLLDTICTISNVTVIYVSHYQDEIPKSVTKVYRLKDGMHQQQAPAI